MTFTACKVSSFSSPSPSSVHGFVAIKVGTCSASPPSVAGVPRSECSASAVFSPADSVLPSPDIGFMPPKTDEPAEPPLLPKLKGLDVLLEDVLSDPPKRLEVKVDADLSPEGVLEPNEKGAGAGAEAPNVPNGEGVVAGFSKLNRDDPAEGLAEDSEDLSSGLEIEDAPKMLLEKLELDSFDGSANGLAVDVEPSPAGGLNSKLGLAAGEVVDGVADAVAEVVGLKPPKLNEAGGAGILAPEFNDCCGEDVDSGLDPTLVEDDSSNSFWMRARVNL